MDMTASNPQTPDGDIRIHIIVRPPQPRASHSRATLRTLSENLNPKSTTRLNVSRQGRSSFSHRTTEVSGPPLLSAPCPPAFRVKAKAVTYSAICIWDALAIAAALHQDATIDVVCGDCGEPMKLEVKNNALVRGGSPTNGSRTD